MKTNVYTDKQAVAKAFSTFLSERIKNNHKLTIALSGGSTPKVVFDYMAENYQDLDWTKVHFFWGDERCVLPDNEDSNYKMTAEHLLNKIKIPEENIHRILGESDPEKEAKRYDELLVEMLESQNGTPQFDLVILGMGSDGHTASIFPHEIELWDSKHNCEVAIHPNSGQKRITITGKVINNAKEVAFLVTGNDKLEKVTEILAQSDISKNYPASLVKPSSGELYWFLDELARYH